MPYHFSHGGVGYAAAEEKSSPDRRGAKAYTQVHYYNYAEMQRMYPEFLNDG